jgi:hypothetical protein
MQVCGKLLRFARLFLGTLTEKLCCPALTCAVQKWRELFNKIKMKYMKKTKSEMDKTVDQLSGQRNEERKNVQSAAKVS